MRQGQPENIVPLSDDQFRKILAGADIEYRAPGPVPEKRLLRSDLRELPKPIQVYATSMIDACRYYLSWPTLVDKFPSHDKRREWRNSMVKQWGISFNEKYERNKLKSPAGNMVAYFDGLLQLLDEAGTEETPLVRDLRNVRKILPNTAAYNDEMSLEEKLAFIRSVDAGMYSFIDLMSEKVAA